MDILETKITQFPYPTSLVRWGYSLLGGAIGGTIVATISLIFDSADIGIYIPAILLFTVGGSVVGLIPAIITGL